ncbi:MAG TPA: hypothetical protein VFH38_07690 [Jatrophihabitans sp.]|nr:hypothetical protein [Jatrophihabitans sp.]
MSSIGERGRRVGRWGCAVAIAGALFAAACSSAGNGVPTSAPGESVPSAAPATAPASALEGTWQTGNVSVDEMVAALRRAGLQEWIQPFRARAGMGSSNVFRLTIADGAWREEYSRDGGPFADFDDAGYRVSGDTVRLTRDAGSYQWRVAAGVLTLTFVAHSMSGSDRKWGIPGEVLQRAFYTAAPFERRP